VAANPVPRGLPTRRERSRPGQGVPLVRATRRLPQILAPAEVDALMAALHVASPLGPVTLWVALYASSSRVTASEGLIMIVVYAVTLIASVILAGIRTATIITIGVATIAAAIGAGGLGTFIFRGVALVSDALILAGAIPAALLALLADFFLGLLERRLKVS